MSDYASKAKPLAKNIIDTARRLKKKEGDAYVEFEVKHMDDPDYASSGFENKMLDKYKAEVDTQFGWVTHMFMRFEKPDPDSFTPIIKSTKEAQTRLESKNAESAANMADGDLSVHWRGDFSDNLRNIFLSPIASGIPQNQAVLTSTLVSTLENYKKMLTVLQGNMLHLGDQTVKALEASEGKSGGDQATGLAILSCLGAVASAALAIPTGGASLVVTAAALSTMSAGAGLASSLISPDGDIPLGADTVDGVMGNLIDAVSQVNEKQTAAEDKIIGVLTDNYTTVTKNRQAANKSSKASSFMPARPALDGAGPDKMDDKFIPND